MSEQWTVSFTIQDYQAGKTVKTVNLSAGISNLPSAPAQTERIEEIDS
jgi:hypothetical protein